MNTRLMSLCSLAAALTVSASNSLSAADQSPVPLSQVAPVYSHELRASDVEGEVVVVFTITANGEVASPVVVKSTNQLLDYPTLAAVRKWKFTPAMKDGVAVNVRVVQHVAFAIPELHADSSRLMTSNAHPSSPERRTVGFD